jgi:hypothetical protein
MAWVARLVVAACVGIVGLAGIAAAQVGMPDPSLMNGQALPAPELPDGTVTVRVMRQAVGNDAPGEMVELVAGNERRDAVTDAEGRAEFPGLISGIQGTATAVVDGETLVSAPFTVPATGGLRVILIAGVAAAAPAAAPAVPAIEGTVVIGANSRIIAQFQDDTLQVFYLLEILNNERAPVDIGGPVLIELPRPAAGTTVLGGSSPNATANGTLLTVVGPFQPGTTSVQVAYTLPHTSPDVTLTQAFPVAVQGINFGIEQVAGLTATSSQFVNTGQFAADDGTPYFMGDLPALSAGGAVTIELSGLPVHSTLPRTIALVFAVLLLAGGAWMAWSGQVDDEEIRRRLTARRDTLLGDLARLEARRQSGREAPRDADRRRQLTAELELIYAELDTAGMGPRGGGEDIAA